MKIIVVGCGRLGRDLSLNLSRSGHRVTVVDSDEEAFEKLGPRFPGQTVTGIAFDRDVLISAGIERADGLAAVTSSDDTNLLTGRIARNLFHVPQGVARLYEPSRADVYQKLGLQCISSTSWGAGRITELLTHSRLDHVLQMGSGEVSIVELEVGPKLAGHKVQDVNISTEIKVVSITRAAKAFIPNVATVFQAGDLVHVAVVRSAQDRLETFVEG